ncbi:MAG: arginine--tRNA ligase [Coriobacteriaceae bacterium]|nr:arginine--tRNA ligase [Coriobacteriaceae bacterium]
MRHAIERIVLAAIEAAIAAGELSLPELPDAAVERPRDATHGDWATSVSLRLAKQAGKPPREIAQIIAAHIQANEHIASVEVAGPGFINLRLSPLALQQVIRDAREQGSKYGRNDYGLDADGNQKTINVEFVSANPTGPMHVGHGRWAALGNAMCNVLEHSNWQVTREFYINDAGAQMDVFGRSVVARYLQLCGQDAEVPENGYGGSYVTQIAQLIYDREAELWLSCQGDVWRNDETGETWPNTDVEKADMQVAFELARDNYFREQAYQMMLAHMRDVLDRVGVRFDVWFSERSLYNIDKSGVINQESEGNASAAPAGASLAEEGRSPIEIALARLEQAGYLFEQDDATWFRSTDFGDDKDRVLIKSDGSYTYFAPDIAYHLDKFERRSGSSDSATEHDATGQTAGGSEYLVDLWGADHHGYVKRMQAACQALGHGGKLTVVLGQLVNLFRAGEVVRMSKRTGEMVTFEELIDEVGADATKYLMLSRSSDQTIDFDIEVAKKQDASNPVYYVQYAHARICSILRKATSTADVSAAITAINSDADLSLLVQPSELDLARAISQLGEVIEGCARDLAPFRLTHYAEELAATFTQFYHQCQVIGDDDDLTQARLYLVDATRSVLALVLGLLGVTSPERM